MTQVPEARLAPGRHDFAWFSGTLASWFGAFGMQGPLFAWLLVAELGASDEWVGIAQSSVMLPSALLLLVGGATADRVDPRRMLVVLHGLGALPVLLLAAAVVTDGLSLPLMLGFGIGMGIVSGLSMPARDTLLSRVAGADMLRAVTTMTAVQFGAQASGALLAGAASWFGSAPMLGLQAAVLLCGSFLALRIPSAAPLPPAPVARSTWHDIADGLRQVAREPRLRWPLCLVIAVGCFFVGPYSVTFPIIIRDVYDGRVLELSIVMMMFPLGTIAGSLVLRRRGLRRKGLAALLALVFGAANLDVVALGLGYPVMVAATFAWGLGGAVFINCSRTLFQEAAPPTQRGRVLAVYQLGFMGAAPIGAIAAGALSARVGSLGALHAYAAAMLVVVLAIGTLTTTPRME